MRRQGPAIGPASDCRGRVSQPPAAGFLEVRMSPEIPARVSRQELVWSLTSPPPCPSSTGPPPPRVSRTTCAGGILGTPPRSTEALKHPYVVQFHNPDDEFECERPIRIPIDDNTKLTVVDYRERLYEQVLRKKKEQRRSHRQGGCQGFKSLQRAPGSTVCRCRVLARCVARCIVLIVPVLEFQVVLLWLCAGGDIDVHVALPHTGGGGLQCFPTKLLQVS